MRPTHEPVTMALTHEAECVCGKRYVYAFSHPSCVLLRDTCDCGEVVEVRPVSRSEQ